MEAQVTDLRWRKSSYSGNGGDCVETASRNGVVFVRDTRQDGRGLVQTYSVDEWRKFLTALKAS